MAAADAVVAGSQQTLDVGGQVIEDSGSESNRNEGSGGVAAIHQVSSDAVEEIVKASEMNARWALEELLDECTEHMWYMHDAVVTEVKSALDSLAKMNGGKKESANALLAMGRARAACEPVPSKDQFRHQIIMPHEQFLEERVVGVENTVRDVAVGRCQMACSSCMMNDRPAFIVSLREAFGEALNEDKGLHSQLMYARRQLIPEVANRFLSNSEQASIKHGCSRGRTLL